MNRMIMVVLVLALGYFAFDKFLLAPAPMAEPAAPVSRAITPSVVPPPSRDQQASQVDKTTCPKSVRQVLEQQRIRPDGVPNDELNYCAHLVQIHHTQASYIVAITTTANGVSFREPMYVFARARKPDATLRRVARRAVYAA